jgi:glucose/arabinose dehydrogenase
VQENCANERIVDFFSKHGSIYGCMTFQAVLVVAASALIVSATQSATVPPGFSVSTIPITGLTNITDIAWAPDDSQRLFIACQFGQVRIVKNGVLLPSPFLTISSLNTMSESGIIGMCFDPNFLLNGYAYLFVSTSAFEQRILRYQAIGDYASNRVDLIQNIPSNAYVHNGGGIAIGHDGRLYAAIGEGGPRPSDLDSMAGKIIRANLDGTAPALNPFRASHELVWARGFRNPFKMCVQPETGLIWVNVAGSWYEQIFLVNRGNHAGYHPVLYENNQPQDPSAVAQGYITPRIKYRTRLSESYGIADAVRTNNVSTFVTTGVHGFRKGEKITVAGVADSSFNLTSYVHSTPSPSTFTFLQSGPNASSTGGTASTLNIGGCVTGGLFYNSSAFPAEYHGNYFFCDIVSGRIMRAVLDSSNEVSSVDYFVTGITNVLDLAAGPDGALYYVGYKSHDPAYPEEIPELIYRLAHTNIPQTLVVSPKTFFMAEGGVSMCSVRLATLPESDIAVTITASSGSAISTTNTALIFTAENHTVPQPVYFHASADPDPWSSRATFVLSAPGVVNQEVKVTAFDPDGGCLRFMSVARSNAVTRLELAAEPRVSLALEGSTDLVGWVTVTNATLQGESITFLDVRDGSPSQQFYRVVMVQ